MSRRRSPLEVIPPAVARAVTGVRSWFVIGGQAVRCYFPYRPSDDVDFGVEKKKELTELLARLRSNGKVEIIETSTDTAHLIFEGHDVSIFVLPKLAKYVDDQALTIDGILATKLHAILDRGTRRDFFDLYVVLSEGHLGVIECVRALREVNRGTDINEGLVLRALTYFDDAEREAPLPGEAPGDWGAVKRFFTERVGAQLIPPSLRLGIQSRSVLPADKRKKARASTPTSQCSRSEKSKASTPARRRSRSGSS